MDCLATQVPSASGIEAADVLPNSSTESTNYRVAHVDLLANLLQDPRIGLVPDDDCWFDIVVVQSIHGVGHRPHRPVVHLHSVQLDAAADLAAHEIDPVAVAACVPSVLAKLGRDSISTAPAPSPNRQPVLRSVLSIRRDIASTAHTITAPPGGQSDSPEITP